MRTLQLILLGAFALCAVLAFLFQLWAGMAAGRSEERVNAPQVEQRQKLARLCAVLAAVLLAANIIVGVIGRA